MSFEQYSREDIHIDNNVTEYRSLKETIDSYQTATDARKEFLKASIDKHYITTQIDKLRTTDPYKDIQVTDYDGDKIEDSKQKSKAIQVYVANLLVADTDYKSGTLFSGIGHENFLKYNIKEFADHLKKDGKEYNHNINTKTAIISDNKLGEGDLYPNYYDIFKELIKNTQETKNGNTIEARQFKNRHCKHLASLMFSQEILQYCAYTYESKDDGTFTLFYMKDPNSIKTLTLTNAKQGYSNYAQGVHNLDKWKKAKGQEVFGDLNKISTKEKFKGIQDHYNVRESQVENQMKTAEVDNTSASDDLDLDIPQNSQQKQSEAAEVETKRLSGPEILKRTIFLENKCKDEGNFMYKALRFLGIDTRLVLGLVAQDASVTTADLDFTVLGVMSAMGTLITRKLLRKEILPKGFFNKEEAHKEEGAKVEDENTVLVSGNSIKLGIEPVQAQSSLHSNKRRKAVTGKELMKTSTNPDKNCLYLGRHTIIKSTKELAFHADLEGKKEIAIAKDAPGITVKEDNGTFTYNTNKTRAFIVKSTIQRATDIVGHFLYGKTKDFETNNYQTSSKTK